MSVVSYLKSLAAKLLANPTVRSAVRHAVVTFISVVVAGFTVSGGNVSLALVSAALAAGVKLFARPGWKFLK